MKKLFGESRSSELLEELPHLSRPVAKPGRVAGRVIRQVAKLWAI
jgi:hypothetical protein